MVGPGWRWDPGFGFPASRSSVLGSFQQVRQLGPIRLVAIGTGLIATRGRAADDVSEHDGSDDVAN